MKKITKNERIEELSVMLEQVKQSLMWIKAHGGLGYGIHGVLKTRIEEINDVLYKTVRGD